MRRTSTYLCPFILALAAACAAGRDPDVFKHTRGGGGSGPTAGARFTPAGAGGASSGGTGGTEAGGFHSGGSTPPPANGGALPGGEGGTVAAPEIPEVCELASAGAGGANSPTLAIALKSNSDETSSFTRGEVQVANEGDTGYELEELELRYYFDSEFTAEETGALRVAIDHAQVSGTVYRGITASVDGEIFVLEPELERADAFIRIAFKSSAGELMPGETVLVQFRVVPPDDSYYQVTGDQTNDYSYGACPLHAASWSRVVLLIRGELGSGVPPQGWRGAGEGGAAGEGGTGGAGEAGAGGSQSEVGGAGADGLAGSGGAGGG